MHNQHGVSVGFEPPARREGSLHILSVFAQIISTLSSFPLQSKDLQLPSLNRDGMYVTVCSVMSRVSSAV